IDQLLGGSNLKDCGAYTFGRSSSLGSTSDSLSKEIITPAACAPSVKASSLMFNYAAFVRKLIFPRNYFRTALAAAVVARCGNLEELDLSQSFAFGCNPVLDAAVICCPNLKSLDIRGCRFTTYKLTALLSARPNLHLLDLRDCTNLFSTDYFYICKHLPPNLKIFRTGNDEQSSQGLYPTFDDESLSLLSQRCETIEELTLNGCIHVTDVSVDLIVERWAKTLTYLDLQECRAVSDASAAGIAKLTQLRVLRLNLIDQLTDAAVVPIATACTKLERVFLWYCGISDASVTAFSRNCPNLWEIHLKGIPSITDKSIRSLVSHCHSLEILNLSWMPSLSDDTLDAIGDHCLELQTLFLSGSPASKRAWRRLVNAERTPRLSVLYVHKCGGLTE
ncbi:hypothetical protein HK102_009672, partial [Quaeritorhiza haematococci]